MKSALISPWHTACALVFFFAPFTPSSCTLPMAARDLEPLLFPVPHLSPSTLRISDFSKATYSVLPPFPLTHVLPHPPNPISATLAFLLSLKNSKLIHVEALYGLFPAPLIHFLNSALWILWTKKGCCNKS